MVAPGAILGDVHAGFAFAGGGHQHSMNVNQRLVEERRWLPSPDALADIVEKVDQGVHLSGLKTTAEITSSRWIGNATGAEGIEETTSLRRSSMSCMQVPLQRAL